MLTRLATVDDIPAIAKIASDAARPGPWFHAYYPRGIPAEDHIQNFHRRFVRIFEEGKLIVLVAVDETARLNKKLNLCQGSDGSGEVVVGFLTFEKVQGLTKDEPLDTRPPLSTPKEADVPCMVAWRAKLNSWKDEIFNDVGPYYRGDLLGVAPKCQKAGIGSSLCKYLAKKAEADNLLVYFESVYYAVPFYQHFAEANGYIVKTIGDAYKLQSSAKTPVFVHFIKFDKDPDWERRASMRRRSSWQ